LAKERRAVPTMRAATSGEKQRRNSHAML
jgi:hypothetical protein